jgi:hypothetical protein
MIRVIGMHRSDQGNLIHAAADVWEQRTNLGATVSAWRELPLWRFEKNPFVAGSVLDFRVVEFDLLADIAREIRLGIKGVDVRDAAGHEEKDHVLRSRWKMSALWSERI